MGKRGPRDRIGEDDWRKKKLMPGVTATEIRRRRADAIQDSLDKEFGFKDNRPCGRIRFCKGDYR